MRSFVPQLLEAGSDNLGMKDIEEIVCRLYSLREPHRGRALQLIARMMDAVEDRAAEYAERVTQPMMCPPGVG